MDGDKRVPTPVHTVHFSLCSGVGLDLCRDCRRCADNQPDAAQSPHQAWLTPQRYERRCGDYMGSVGVRP